VVPVADSQKPYDVRQNRKSMEERAKKMGGGCPVCEKGRKTLKRLMRNVKRMIKRRKKKK
jgi:hypothetical protein